MRLTRSILEAPPVIIVLLAAACIGIASWGLIAYAVPSLNQFVETWAEQYDAFFPAITIRNGQASIREKQPYIVEGLGDKDMLVMVDTREGKDAEIQEQLKKVSMAAILTRDNFVMKNQQEVRWFPLKDLPDMVINSTNIQDVLREYLPKANRLIVMVIIVYFLFAKTLQILVLALVPYLAARSYRFEMTYGQALKLSSVALIVPVVLEFALNLGGVHIPAQFALYFAIYIALLWLATRDLAHDHRVLEGPAPNGRI